MSGRPTFSERVVDSVRGVRDLSGDSHNELALFTAIKTAASLLAQSVLTAPDVAAAVVEDLTRSEPPPRPPRRSEAEARVLAGAAKAVRGSSAQDPFLKAIQGRAVSVAARCAHGEEAVELLEAAAWLDFAAEVVEWEADARTTDERRESPLADAILASAPQVALLAGERCSPSSLTRRPFPDGSALAERPHTHPARAVAIAAAAHVPPPLARREGAALPHACRAHRRRGAQAGAGDSLWLVESLCRHRSAAALHETVSGLGRSEGCRRGAAAARACADRLAARAAGEEARARLQLLLAAVNRQRCRCPDACALAATVSACVSTLEEARQVSGGLLSLFRSACVTVRHACPERWPMRSDRDDDLIAMAAELGALESLATAPCCAAVTARVRDAFGLHAGVVELLQLAGFDDSLLLDWLIGNETQFLPLLVT
jgi:hypothetical protein